MLPLVTLRLAWQAYLQGAGLDCRVFLWWRVQCPSAKDRKVPWGAVQRRERRRWLTSGVLSHNNWPGADQCAESSLRWKLHGQPERSSLCQALPHAKEMHQGHRKKEGKVGRWWSQVRREVLLDFTWRRPQSLLYEWWPQEHQERANRLLHHSEFREHFEGCQGDNRKHLCFSWAIFAATHGRRSFRRVKGRIRSIEGHHFQELWDISLWDQHQSSGAWLSHHSYLLGGMPKMHDCATFQQNWQEQPEIQRHSLQSLWGKGKDVCSGDKDHPGNGSRQSENQEECQLQHYTNPCTNIIT